MSTFGILVNNLSCKIDNSDFSFADVNYIILIIDAIMVSIKDSNIKHAIDIQVNNYNILSVDGHCASNFGRSIIIDVNKIDSNKMNFCLRLGLRLGGGLGCRLSHGLSLRLLMYCGVGCYILNRRFDNIILIILADIITDYSCGCTDGCTANQSSAHSTSHLGCHAVIGLTLSILHIVCTLIGLCNPGFVISIHSVYQLVG